MHTFPNQPKFGATINDAVRDAGTSVGQGGKTKSWGQYKLTKNKKIVTNYQVRRPTRWGA